MDAPVNILIVDDRPENRLALRAILDSPDYRLVEAASGQEALRALLREPFAVVLLDVRMPEMDGFEVATIVRSRPSGRALPILFLTAEAGELRSMFRGYESGAVDYLVKPLRPEIVRAKVAVFAELYRTRRRVEEQGERLLRAERREAEVRMLEAKLASERHYRNLAEAVPHIVWTARPDGTIDYFNRRWFESTGRVPDGAGDGWLSAVHPDDRDRVQAIWERAVRTGAPCEFELRLRTEPGPEYRWHLGRALPEREVRHGIASWLGTFTDIDHQKQAQAILTEFKETLDAVLDAVFIFDPLSWRLQYLNRGASALLGLSREQLLRMRTLDLLPEYTEAEFRKLLDALGDGSLPRVSLETRVRHGAEAEVPVELSLQHIWINGGKLVGIGRDITDRKRAEAERELLYQEALEAVRVRDEFLSVASHELKTPLTSLTLHLQTLLRDGPQDGHSALPPAATRKLNLAMRQTRRIGRLVEELLDVSRISSGRFRLARKDGVELAQVVRDVVERFGAELSRAGCAVTVDAPAAVAGTWDRSRLDEVITNLLTNAIKFGADRPIDISIRADGDDATLVVRDHGIGVPPEARDRIFGRFERAVSSRHFGGLGLGLYIVQKIVEGHGGRVRAENTPGGGATFVVTLPRAIPAAEALPAASDTSTPDRGQEPEASAATLH